MLRRLWDFLILKIIGRLNFNGVFYFFTGKTHSLKREDKKIVFGYLKNQNYIILINRKTHVSTFFINLYTTLIHRKKSLYSHAAINLELEDVTNPYDIDIIEAVGQGVIKSSFDEILNCDAVCLLKVKAFTRQDWENCIYIMNKFVEQKTPYDTMFNYKNADKVSCVELVIEALKASPKFNELKHLKDLLNKKKRISPQDLRDCQDFVTILEIRR